MSNIEFTVSLDAYNVEKTESFFAEQWTSHLISHLSLNV